MAGYTARSVASSHQRAGRRVASCSTITPPAISATPLATTSSFFQRARRRGTMASYWRGITKCMAPAKIQKPAASARHGDMAGAYAAQTL